MQGCDELNDDGESSGQTIIIYYEVKVWGGGRRETEQKQHEIDMRCIHRVYTMESEYTNSF